MLNYCEYNAIQKFVGARGEAKEFEGSRQAAKGVVWAHNSHLGAGIT
jgi:erythromycin esterase-like protein